MDVGRRGKPFSIILLAVTIFLTTPAAVDTGLSAAAGGNPSPAADPLRPAAAGVLDLRQDDGLQPILHSRNMTLDGVWDFYWNTLIPPAAFQDSSFGKNPFPLPVPGGWKNQVIDGDTLPGEGYGTYRLRIVGDRATLDGESLALYIPYVRTAHRLFVNGRLVASRGVVGENRAASSPAAGTEVVSIASREPAEMERQVFATADGQSDDLRVIDIVVHVSNFHFRDGGLGRSLALGTEKNIRSLAQRSLAIEIFLAASLLVIGLYHLGMWAIRPQDRHFLSFALFCLLIAFRNAVMDQAPITLFLPDISWEVLLKVEYIGYYLGAPMIILFLHHMYPDEYDRRVVWTAMGVGAAFSLFVAATPGSINSHALVFFHGVTVVILAVIVGGLILAARRRRAGARVILGAGVIVSFIVIHDILFFWGVLGTRGLVPVSVLGMVGAYSFVLSKKFSDEFEYQRRLMEENADLLRTINEQIIQIKNSRRLMTEREERTRREVAEMLHGSVQSRLLSAQHHLRKSLNLLQPTQFPPEDGDDLTIALQSLEKAGRQIAAVNEEEIRRLSHLLHPMLLRIGLVPALQSLADRFSEQLNVELKPIGVLAEDPLHVESIVPETLRLAMYRIVEEALTNVVKHAGAQRVIIEVAIVDSSKGKFLSGTVADDGVGMEVHGRDVKGGFGMQMIAARVEEVGGCWSIGENPGGGTRVGVRLPLPEELADNEL